MDISHLTGGDPGLGLGQGTRSLWLFVPLCLASSWSKMGLQPQPLNPHSSQRKEKGMAFKDTFWKCHSPSPIGCNLAAKEAGECSLYSGD